MKIKDGYLLSEVAGTTVVVPVDPAHTFRGMLKLNGTGTLLWERLATDAEESELVALLVSEYEIDGATAARDVDAFLTMLRGFGVLEEA